ncbi:MAG: alpha/beta hydrolase [Chloroflexota bacterium]
MILIFLMILILLLSPLLLYTGRYRERFVAQAVRRQRELTYTQLSDGITHYTVYEPKVSDTYTNKRGTVVMVHGMFVASYVYDRLIQAAVDAGFRVITYDHYNRGWSDRLETPMTREVYRRQLRELIQTVVVKKRLPHPVHLIGYSLGGAIVADFAHHHQEYVASATLIAPLVQGGRLPIVNLLRRYPVLAPYFVRVLLVDRLIKRADQGFLVHPNPEPFYEYNSEQFDIKGTEYAIVQQLTHATDLDYVEDYQALGQSRVPIQLLYGTRDTEIPPNTIALARENMPSVEYHEFDAGHGILQDQMEAVAPVIVAFLSRQVVA